MFKKIAVIGLGLIGGSVAAACKKHSLAQHIVGYSIADADMARRLGLVDDLATSAAEACLNADLVVFATPPSTIATLATECVHYLAEGGVATDVGSTKYQMVLQFEEQIAQCLSGDAAAKKLALKLSSFVPAHPIAGGDESGPGAANAQLFCDAKVILTPLTTNSAKAVEKIDRFWCALGAQTEQMSAQAHDRAYALVSHLPHWVAFALAHSIAQHDDAHQLKSRSGAGLRDTTRIAGSSPELWADIGLQNKDQLMLALENYQDSFGQLRNALANSNREQLVALMSKAQKWKRT